MAVIVVHKVNGNKYALIGTGFGMYKSTSPSFLGGSLFPYEDEDVLKVAAVCDLTGSIHWLMSDELEVVEIDGVKIEDMKQLDEFIDVEELDPAELPLDYCPGCGKRVDLEDEICPYCGLRLISRE